MESVVVYCKDIHKYFCEKEPAERRTFRIFAGWWGHQPGQPAVGRCPHRPQARQCEIWNAPL